MDTAEVNTADMIRSGMHPSEAVVMDRNETIKLIREALKKRSGKTWSVTGGRGSAWGWIRIHSPPARRAEYGDMSEADRAELGELLGETVHHQGVSIPAASDYRREYVTRALGLPVLDIGKHYWD